MQTKETTGISSKLHKWLRTPIGKNSRKGLEGQALVEFALTLPFLIMLFVVLVELGFLIRSHMTISAATSEGVRSISTKGNAEPAAYVRSDGQIVGGNEVSTRVGVDGDTVMVQNVNTALQSERKNVKVLMTYRADATESPNAGDIQNGVNTNIGWYGIGGKYGVYYNNPTVSLHPFQEVFTFTQRLNGERWFTPTVMSTAECNTLYGASGTFGNNYEPVFASGKTPASGTASYNKVFCGDDSKTSATTGINRMVPLGQIYTNYRGISGNINNVTPISGKARGVGTAGTCGTESKTNSYGNILVIGYDSAIRCTRYSVAPWYPSLRRAGDIGDVVSTDPASTSYYNYQRETSLYFGCSSASLNRSPDYIGIFIGYRHDWFLTFFPGGMELSEKSVKIMEPVGGNFNAPVAPDNNQFVFDKATSPAVYLCPAA